MNRMKTSWIISAICTVFYITTLAQSSVATDPVLFTVEGKNVHVSEFEYIYNKTNSGNADYSRKSVEEYLDLYIKFKLKVQKARDLQLDTIVTLARELEGYRRQLADSYLVDKEVTDKLIEEVYGRKKKEREVSHILFKYKKGTDSTQVEKIAKGVLDMLLKGADFRQMVIAQSEDPNVKNNEGNLGFMTAMMPNGFYAFENAIFSTPIGSVHPELVMTPMGIHIIKVTGEREASGEIEVSHVLIRDPENSPVPGAEERIKEAYAALEQGMYFDQVVKEFSEDRLTLAKGGYLGYFGINRYEKAFEDAAFSLKENGDYSKPFKTSIGWHIVKRLNKKDLEALNVVKGRIQNQVTQDQRFEIGRKKMIERIKKDAGFSENREVLDGYADKLNMEFLTYRWKPEDAKSVPLFQLGDSHVATTSDFSDFLVRNQRKRLQMARDSNVVLAVQVLYSDFINESCIKFEEAKLEVKYPEFKALMREYEEGILLFEATKLMVWDKASQDTTGLRSFHNKHKNNYMWGERAQVAKYTLKNVNEKTAAKIYKYAAKNNSEKTLKKFNKKSEIALVDIQKHERATFDQLKGLPWESGYVSQLSSSDDGVYTFSVVESLLAAQPKKLSEARGYIIADYQDYLEREWVSSLRKEYSVNVDEGALTRLIRY